MQQLQDMKFPAWTLLSIWISVSKQHHLWLLQLSLLFSTDILYELWTVLLMTVNIDVLYALRCMAHLQKGAHMRWWINSWLVATRLQALWGADLRQRGHAITAHSCGDCVHATSCSALHKGFWKVTSKTLADCFWYRHLHSLFKLRQKNQLNVWSACDWWQVNSLWIIHQTNSKFHLIYLMTLYSALINGLTKFSQKNPNEIRIWNFLSFE